MRPVEFLTSYARRWFDMRTQKEIETRFAKRDELDQVRSFFLVGIGGAGMSAVARMLNARGFAVKGTDATDSPLIDSLRELGIEIWIGHSGENLQVGDALILTDAIDLSTSPEVKRAEELGVPLFRRSQALGWLLKDKKTIAVVGTHGKTTTSSFLGLAMRAAGYDPTVVIGAEVSELGGSVSEGKGEFAVVEACEAYNSLHDFDPYLVLLNNLEPDHLDFHGNWENLRDSVCRFVTRISAGGALIYSSVDAGAQEVADRYSGSKLGFRPDSAAELAESELNLNQKGLHNLANASAALSVLDYLGGVTPEAVRAIEEFGGAQRRQQKIYEGAFPGKNGWLTILDDYAHHPTEVKAALKAIREGWEGRLVVVFQPHLYSRTQPLIKEFAEALSEADLVVLTDIYPAREAPIPGISSFLIAEKVTKPCRYVPSRFLLPREVAKWVAPGDVVVSMGAGNIDQFPREFLNELRRQDRVKTIGIAYGGDSTEREVSLLSGRAVAAAVERLGYRSVLMDVSAMLLGEGQISPLVGVDRPDFVILTTHGGNGENGAIQGFFELIHVPHSGPGILASARAISKEVTKTVLSAAGLPVPKGKLLVAGDELPDFDGPYVVKPNKHGSTVGLSFVGKREDLARAVERAFEYDDEVLVEERIEGIEISVPVFGDRALPAVEVVPRGGQYDFASKYQEGETAEICPARIRPEQEELARDYALRAHQALGCRGVTRTDMFVQNDRIVVLETNTVPGMTPTSLVPRSAQEAGMSFDEVVRWIIEDGCPET